MPDLIILVKELAKYEKLESQMVASAADYRKFGFGPRPYFQALLAEVTENGAKRAVGFAIYFFTFSTFEGRPTLFLEDLFVLPEYRGRGIGRRFLKELARIALERDCARMEWMVLDWNEPAIQFYRSLGALPLDDWTVYRLNQQAIEKLAGE